jgi:hypothetical protein
MVRLLKASLTFHWLFTPALILPVIPHMDQVLRGVSAASGLKVGI